MFYIETKFVFPSSLLPGADTGFLARGVRDFSGIRIEAHEKGTIKKGKVKRAPLDPPPKRSKSDQTGQTTPGALNAANLQIGTSDAVTSLERGPNAGTHFCKGYHANT